MAWLRTLGLSALPTLGLVGAPNLGDDFEPSDYTWACRRSQPWGLLALPTLVGAPNLGLVGAPNLGDDFEPSDHTWERLYLERRIYNAPNQS